ncbi:hypothetical protein D3C80_1818620 [compost metagenome]
MESVSPEKSNFAVVKSSPSVSIEASNFSKFPETLVNIMCFTLNPISECAVSIDHFVVDIIFVFKKLLSC